MILPKQVSWAFLLSTAAVILNGRSSGRPSRLVGLDRVCVLSASSCRSSPRLVCIAELALPVRGETASALSRLPSHARASLIYSSIWQPTLARPLWNHVHFRLSGLSATNLERAGYFINPPVGTAPKSRLMYSILFASCQTPSHIQLVRCWFQFYQPAGTTCFVPLTLGTIAYRRCTSNQSSRTTRSCTTASADSVLRVECPRLLMQGYIY